MSERFVQHVLDASLPFEELVGDRAYRVRLASARFDIERGTARVLVRGTARSTADTTLFADLLIQGVVGIRDIDYESSQLALRLEITDVYVVRAGPQSLGVFSNPVATYFSRRKASDWNTLEPPLDLPLQLAHAIDLPATEGDVTLPAVTLPIRTRLIATTAFADRLVASIELLPDSARGATMGPPTGSWDAPLGSAGLRPPRPDTSDAPQVSTRDLDALARRVAALAAPDSLWQAMVGQNRGVVALVPEVVIEDLVDRLAQRYRQGVTVDLSPELHEEIVQPIRVRMLGTQVKAGELRLDIRVHHLAGRLIARDRPVTELVPPDGLETRLRLAVEEGRGTARVRAEWDPNAAAWLVCRGFRAERTLAGRIDPLPHVVRGRVRFELSEGRIVARPTLVRDRVLLRIELTPASWDSVRATFAEQDKPLRCGLVLDPDSAVVKLKRLGTRGIRVRLPGAAPEFELPLRYETDVGDGAYRLEATVRSPVLEARPDYLRLGFDAEVHFRRAAKADSVRG